MRFRGAPYRDVDYRLARNCVEHAASGARGREMTISLQTGSPALATVNGSDSSQAIGSNGPSATGDSPFAAVLQEQQQQEAAATPAPVAVNGSATTTQCYTYDFLANSGDDVYEIAGAQVRGMPVVIYDPNGVLPSVTILPTDDAVAVMKTNNVPITTPDQGVSYEYNRLFDQDFTPAVAHGAETPTQLEVQVVQQMQAEGWSSGALAPWINQVASYLPAAASDASPAPTGSLPLSTADSAVAGTTNPGSSASTTSAPAETPAAAAEDPSPLEEAAVAPPSANPGGAGPASTPASLTAAGTASADTTTTSSAAVAAPAPVVVNGSRTTTQGYSYDFLTQAGDDVYEIAGAQVRGMPVVIYDPNGVLPSVTILPADDAVAVMKANNVPITTPDQGVRYEYNRLFDQDFTAAVAHGAETPTQLEAQVVRQMLAEGWSSDSLAPWTDQLASNLQAPASGASPAATGSLS